MCSQQPLSSVKMISVSIPEEKIRENLNLLEELRRAQPLKLKMLRKTAGKLTFVSSLIPHLRPFMRSMWRTLADVERQGPSYSRHLSRKLSVLVCCCVLIGFAMVV